MSNLVPTKKVYVERLRKMLARKQPCGCCPTTKYYLLSDDDAKEMAHVDGCGLCIDFVDIPKDRHMKDCPCGFYGRKKALARAHKAIAAYDKGTHKWCKEKP